MTNYYENNEIYLQKVEKILILVKIFDFTRHYAAICQLRGMVSIMRDSRHGRVIAYLVRP